MIRQFILNNVPIAQTDREDLVSYYLSLGYEEVPIIYNNQFISPLWNGSTFIENATPEDIEVFNSQKRELLLGELTNKCVHLTDRSIISSVAKEEKDLNYLNGQIDRYLKKYQVAKYYIDNSEAILNQIWYDQIVSEMNTTITETGAPLTIPVFMGLIVQYYEAGQEREQKFNAAIELFRCKTKDLIQTNQFERARTSLELANTVPDTVSMELLDSLLIQLDSI